MAKTFTVCEMITDNGQDVSWYDLYLLKYEDKWKVYKIIEATPDPWGISPRVSVKPIPDAAKTIEGFILDATAGKNAINHLAGPARKSYEQVPSGITQDNPQEINILPLYSDDKSAFYKASYQLADKQIDILLTLYKLDTWRIVSIAQL